MVNSIQHFLGPYCLSCQTEIRAGKVVAQVVKVKCFYVEVDCITSTVSLIELYLNIKWTFLFLGGLKI